ncbi:MAG TPA: nucleoside-diphosphate sugar epimerase/dehydratase [Gemmatimonadales bacterium]|jgi:FlaA1/EpsC-like NDP-sugar epimerase|nr:nucleoside-diphosphate sugar epimerase/dehydratase [Gemmatimonadales bacterium]
MTSAIRNRHVFLSDAVAFVGLPLLAYTARFEGWGWPLADTGALLIYTAATTPLKLSILAGFGLYNRLWAHADVRDFTRVLRAMAISAVLCGIIGAVLLPHSGLATVRVPLSILALDALGSVAAVCAPRTLAKRRAHARSASVDESAGEAALIVGAGAAGEIIAKELLANPKLQLRLAGFVDDDPGKRHQLLCNRPVLGSLADLPRILSAHKITQMIIAMPGAPGTVVRTLIRIANAAGVHARTVPGLFEIISERVSVSALRKVQIQDLLRRDPVDTDLAAVGAVVGGRTVLVTGAGGSIGSELCRQLARLGPKRLLLLGHGENSIYEVQAALRDAFPALETVPLIADVRDRPHVRQLLERHRPEVIFHAAAHKHVPMMEWNVAEAILNNVEGAASLVQAAIDAGTERFVLISTDKAVRPCSVMGTTKRIAEMIVQHAGTRYNREFVAVRFGNVLGSRGSVVPAFLRQIQAGGPVTVTHPDMRRYFMTIPEATQLVLQAGALGRPGNVFVLDMGEQVRIADLAADMIRLSGLEPDVDIEIRYSGIRPGERLAEEILFTGESVEPTAHPKVLRATNEHLPADVERLVAELVEAAQAHLPDEVLRLLLHDLVSERIAPSLTTLTAAAHEAHNETAGPLQRLTPAVLHGTA